MNGKYMLAAVGLSLLVCLPWLALYEKKKASVTEAALVAVMTAFSTVGRVIFAAAPHFKPVTALVIVTGASLGPSAGFAAGALTAAISNMYFGQGPWTFFQMAAWGLIGMAAGFLGEHIRGIRGRLVAFGAVSGAAYSLLMDFCTALMAGDSLSPAKYAAFAVAGLPVTAVYAASNAVFLWILGRPFCRKLARIKRKYIQ